MAVLLRELLGTRSRISDNGCENSEKLRGACCCQVKIRGDKGCIVTTPSPKVSATSGEVKGWKPVTSSTKRKDPTLSRGLQVQDRFSALKGEEEPDMPSSKRSGQPLAHKEEFDQRKEDARVAKRWFWKQKKLE